MKNRVSIFNLKMLCERSIDDEWDEIMSDMAKDLLEEREWRKEAVRAMGHANTRHWTDCVGKFDEAHVVHLDDCPGCAFKKLVAEAEDNN